MPKNLVILPACLALAACTVVPIDNHVRVPDWPPLRVVEHHVPHTEMRDRCGRYAPPLLPAYGCTEFHFDRGEAHIYLSRDYPDPEVRAHERLHAAGYDHVGSNAMRRMWEGWKLRRLAEAEVAAKR